jgi:hypothetical protein
MIAPLLAALVFAQAVPLVSSEKSRQGTGAPYALMRMATTTAGGCLGGGVAPTFIPYGTSLTASSSTSVILCFVQGGTLKTSITVATGQIVTVGSGSTNDGAGACFVLDASNGINGVTKRLENVFADRVGPSGPTSVSAGYAPGVCTTGGTATGATFGRPCFVDDGCTGGQTCYTGSGARAMQRGAYLCGRGSAAASIFVDFDQ